MEAFKWGQFVCVIRDNDGSREKIGLVSKVFPSGRATVCFEDGSFRNFAPSDCEEVEVREVPR